MGTLELELWGVKRGPLLPLEDERVLCLRGVPTDVWLGVVGRDSRRDSRRGFL